MVALGRGTESRAAERARESLGKRAAGAAAAAARQLESLSPTKLGARLSLTASPTKHRASLSGYPSLAASPTKVGESIGERLPPTKHRTRSSHAKPESRQPGGVLSPTRHERSRRVRTAKGRSTDVEAVAEPEELGGHAAALRGRLAARQASLDEVDLSALEDEARQAARGMRKAACARLETLLPDVQALCQEILAARKRLA